MWIIGALISASLLGVYDIFKKLSLKDNAVLPVLFFSTLTSGVFVAPVILLAKYGSGTYFDPILTQPLIAHVHFFLKSIIVGSSWFLAYFAMKHLPITIVSPIRSSGPLWTLLGAVVLFGETMNFMQWVGLVLTIGFYYLFSFSGKREGISFQTNKWVLFMTLATVIGSASSMYDKYLISILKYDRIALQYWFTVYMVPIMGAVMFFVWYPNRKKYTPFQWRHTIMLIGLCLTVADFLYFWAVAQENSLIAIIATMRRSSVIVSFSIGAIIFREQNIKLKALILLGILAGIGLIIWGS
jgi:bacterial/archaeal transporter family protein